MYRSSSIAKEQKKPDRETHQVEKNSPYSGKIRREMIIGAIAVMNEGE